MGTSPHIEAICKTLIHSLWIGLVVAALAALMIALTKKTAAKLRYRLLCGLLLLFVAANLFTLYWELEKTPLNVVNKASLTHVAGAGNPRLYQTLPINTLNGLNDLLIRWSGWIFTSWLVCCLFKSIRLSRELLYIKRIRSTSIATIAESWTNKAAAFSRQLHIRRTIKLAESALVKVPVTIGYFKPLILLPAGMLLQLPPGQVDTILWHELAHILRRDYLVNILQSIVETFFFFNPAIWWLSALIREERENCCDDIVLANTSQKHNYLEALVAFQHYENQPGAYAMGLSLGRNQLMNRLKRMVTRENQKLNTTEKIVLLSGILLCSAFTFIPAIKPQAPANPNYLISKVSFRLSDADRANCEMDAADTKGNHYAIKLAGGQLAALAINNQSVAQQQLAGFYKLVSQVNAYVDAAQRIKAQRRRARNKLPAGNTTGSSSSAEDLAAQSERMRAVIAALVQEKVVSDPNAIESFGLSDEELVVNGQKQPEALHRKLKAQYGIRPQYGLFYGSGKMTGTGIIMDKSDL